MRSLLASAALLGLLLGAPVSSASAHRSMSATTIVTVTAGKPSELRFALSKSSGVSWAAGTVVFKVTNKGKLPHTFKVCSKSASTAKLNVCAGTATKLLSPGQSATLTVTFKKRGVYEYLCTVPGHAAGGMKGLIGIGVKLPAAPPTPLTGGTTTTTSTGSSATTTTTAAALIGDPVAGAAVWVSIGCGSCHTMAKAGATGTLGPNLDDQKPDQNTVVLHVTNGGGVMPAFGQQLSPTQINNIAAYVYKSTF